MWCIIRIPGPRYKKLSETLAQTFEVRKRSKTSDQLGYLFIRHDPDTLRDALAPFEGAFPLYDHATHRPATLTETEVNLFTRLIEDTTLNVIILDRDLSYYAEGHIPLVCIDEPLVGMKGYVVRRHGNRNFIFTLANALTASAANAHTLRFLTEPEYQKALSEGLLTKPMANG